MVAVLALFLLVALALLVWQQMDRRRVLSDRARLEQELQQATALADAISVGDWLSSVQSLANTLVQTGACEAAVLLAVAESGGLEQRAAAGARDWAPGSEEQLKRTVETAQPVSCGTDGLLLPVIEEGEVVGILALRGARPGSPVLHSAARFAGMGLTGLRHYQKQAVLSNTDGLTGLANHRHFQQTLSVALAQAYLENEPLTLLLLDIDHFKKVNDTYGHLFGDLVLRELAYLLRRELPPDAVPARYGGEEFAVILRGEPARNAVEVAERVRNAIAEHQVFDFSSGTRLSVTISCGVAHYELGQGKSRLVARADEGLYASKHDGRNRVTVALPENSTSHLFPS